jgi:CubicO group peptidase (beta-lactamase class C family)
MATQIHGFCEEPYLPLKEALAANFADGLEVGASLAVARHGRLVVDLWGGHADFERTRPWEKDTIAVVYSLTKVSLLFAFLTLVDRGVIDLDKTVAAYWPEFAVGGKGAVTVRQAMTHRAGVPGFDPPVAFETLLDWPAAVGNIAAQAHWFAGEDRVCYHANTYGFLLGEIMRRADGRFPSQILRDEIAGKAGIDFRIGLKSRADVERLAEVGFLEPPTGIDEGMSELASRILMDSGQGDWNAWETQQAEMPGANGYCNARSVARIGAIGASGGTLEGVRYLSQSIVDEASRLQASGVDPFMGPINLGLGFGVTSDALPGPSPTCFHWGGYGGSSCVMDQATGVSFGYVMNNLIATSGRVPETRHDRLWDALGESMRRL